MKRLALLAILIAPALTGCHEQEAHASPGTELVALTVGEIPAQRNCDVEEFLYKVSATDGGNKAYFFGDGGHQSGGTVLANNAGDGVLVVNNSAIPLRCRATTTNSLSKGVTICNLTTCDYSSGKALTWADPSQIACSIPAINRDAGVLTFRGTVYRACR